MYQPNVDNKHNSNEDLDQRLIKRLSTKHKVWHGPTVTCQAMTAETREDIHRWSAEGYFGVEMEAATIFAVSNHFKIDSAALLVIADNLVKEKTVLDVNYEGGSETRREVRRDMLNAALTEILFKN
jgi:purine-nucleoside phosphorylase